MGGDIIYDVPRKPLRPKDQGMSYHARVAHSRPAPLKTEEEKSGARAGAEPLPPPATPEESAGPVIPLTGPGAPVPGAPPPSAGAASDGGAPPDAAGAD